jgi:hypothetical protein
MGSEIHLRGNSAAAVRQAFTGHSAGGGTDYSSGVRAIASHKPAADEDALMLFVGDEEDCVSDRDNLAACIRSSGINPIAFGLLKVGGSGRGQVVTYTAAQLGIPCLNIDEGMFESNDPYVITRTFRDLIASTPVTKRTGSPTPARKSLVEEILGTKLLEKPTWA